MDRNEWHENVLYKGYVIRIRQDDNPENPREWDNLGTMVCWHRRCSMGDTTLGDAYGRPDGKHPFFYNMHDLMQVISKEDTIYLPVYLYEHSGQTVRTYPFNDPWDSGQVGFIYVEGADVRKEYSRKRISKKLRAKVIALLEGEVKEYDQYLTGDVYGYEIFGPVPEDFDPEHDDPEEYNDGDSCWGFFGKDYCIEEAKGVVDYVVKQEGVMA